MPYFSGECSTFQRASGRFSTVFKRNVTVPFQPISELQITRNDLQINRGKSPPCSPN